VRQGWKISDTFTAEKNSRIPAQKMNFLKSNAPVKDGEPFWDQLPPCSQAGKLPKNEEQYVAYDENFCSKDAYRTYCFSPVRSISRHNSSHAQKKHHDKMISPKSPNGDQEKAQFRRISQSPAILMPTPSTYKRYTKDNNVSREPLTDLHGSLDFKRPRDENTFLSSPRYSYYGANTVSPRICSSYPVSQSSCNGRFERVGAPYPIGAQMFYRSSMPLSPATQHTAMRLLANHSSAWNERFNELLEYKKHNGDCLVPQRYPQNPQLGVWVNKQRAEYKLFKEGKKSSMTKERIQALESVGFIWAKRRKGQPTWDLKFDELTEYCQEHGDCLVPTKYAENPALGRWVSTQRAQYKLMQENKPTTMTEERIKMLESLGFVWRLQF
jgi:hypothetical protein